MQQYDGAEELPGSVPNPQEYDDPKKTVQPQHHMELLDSRGEMHRGGEELHFSNSSTLLPII